MRAPRTERYLKDEIIIKQWQSLRKIKRRQPVLEISANLSANMTGI